MLYAPKSRSTATERKPQPFCNCVNKNADVSSKKIKSCSCGESHSIIEWGWSTPDSASSWVVLSEKRKHVTFHPFYSSGTAAAKGDTPFILNYHYYWEVKILTDTYGTDVMVGLGTNKVDMAESLFKFTSLLGQDEESYGLSYTGAVRHNAMVTRECLGFCRGSIVGVRVDMWLGTLEFYLNREPLGVSCYNLRRHEQLVPMVCSTAAQSSMRLIYAASWRASLLVDAAKVLAAADSSESRASLPPGLAYIERSHFWLTLPSEREDLKKENTEPTEQEAASLTKSMLNEVIPDQFVNGFYADSVGRDNRIVVRE